MDGPKEESHTITEAQINQEVIRALMKDAHFLMKDHGQKTIIQKHKTSVGRFLMNPTDHLFSNVDFKVETGDEEGPLKAHWEGVIGKDKSDEFPRIAFNDVPIEVSEGKQETANVALSWHKNTRKFSVESGITDYNIPEKQTLDSLKKHIRRVQKAAPGYFKNTEEKQPRLGKGHFWNRKTA